MMTMAERDAFLESPARVVWEMLYGRAGINGSMTSFEGGMADAELGRYLAELDRQRQGISVAYDEQRNCTVINVNIADVPKDKRFLDQLEAVAETLPRAAKYLKCREVDDKFTHDGEESLNLRVTKTPTETSPTIELEGDARASMAFLAKSMWSDPRPELNDLAYAARLHYGKMLQGKTKPADPAVQVPPRP